MIFFGREKTFRLEYIQKKKYSGWNIHMLQAGICFVVACLCPAAAFHMPVPGARAHRAFHHFNFLAAASLRGRAGRCVGLGANLNRQHDFGIDPNKVRRARSLWALSVPVVAKAVHARTYTWQRRLKRSSKE